MIEQVLPFFDFVASDILLSVFFFVIGLELIEEIKNGELRDFKHAALPAFAACGGVIVPAGIFALFVCFTNSPVTLLNGWAIPTATDVAFSLAVLALFAKKLKGGTKMFLLVLAVVDDIIGIIIIAFAFSKEINALSLLAAIIFTLIWAFFVRKKKCYFFLLIPLAIAVWVAVFKSGIHPTIAGVLLGITVPANRKDVAEDDTDRALKGKNPSTKVSRADLWAEKLSPISSYFIVPVFAMISIIVSAHELLSGFSPSSNHVSSSTQIPMEIMINIALAVTISLVIGKPLGILFFAWIGQHLTPLKLFHGLNVRDLVGTACLGGIGFTVSFLIADLSFSDSLIVAVSRIGVVAGSLISAVLGIIVLLIQVKITTRKKSAIIKGAK